MMSDQYAPRPEHKFSFGLWTVGNRGRDPFGDAVRPPLAPNDAVAMLADVGAWGVNLHDNDLVPIDAPPADRDRIVKDFASACQRHGIVVPMATVNLFFDPVFRDGAFTANDARVRAYALQKTLRAMDIGAELGASTFVLWGRRELRACRRAGVGSRQTFSHRSERSNAGPLRSGLPFWVGKPQSGILAGEVSRGCSIRWSTSLRCPCISH